MAAKAFILIETSVGKNKEVMAALQKMKGMVSVDTVTGPYDLIAVMSGETLNGIGEAITGRVHGVAGISRTVTCLVI